MNQQYKGFPVPEIMQDGHLYHIICDEGIFDGHSENAVLDKWKLKVDTLWWVNALDSGYTEVSDGVLGCPDCGNLVWDPHSHKSFHGDLTNV